jgi:biopolymer transport protein TolQ
VEGQLDIVQILLESGLVVKSVLIALIFASIMSWGIIFKKKTLLSVTKKNNEEFLRAYKQGKTLRDIFNITENINFSPFKNIFDHAYKEFFKISDKAEGSDIKNHFSSFGLTSIERSIRQGANDSNIKLEESLSTLASVSSASPFIGLFGTVWGIINSFTGIAGGGATLDAVAPGIAEALVATAVGLLAAIPAMWFYNKFNNEISVINTEMESLEQDILNLVERSVS